MHLVTATVPTPAGQMTLLGTEECLHVSAFDNDDVDELRTHLEPSLRHLPVRPGDSAAAEALRAYAAGDVNALDTADVSQPGGAFFTAVWTEMRRIAPGTTISYAELAARAGAPRAVRAAASACARNAVCLFVPCHRVVRSDGSLGGYYYGLHIKSRLLEHERVTDR